MEQDGTAQSYYRALLASLRSREAQFAAELERVRTLMAVVEIAAIGEGASDSVQVELPTPSPKPFENQTSATVVPQFMTMAVQPPLTMVEAARRVLAVKGPLHVKQIVAAMQGMGVQRDRDPKAVRASLTPLLLRRDDLFKAVRRGTGIYALADPPEVERPSRG